MAKSRPYTINDEKVSFTITNNKFIGMGIQNSTNMFVPEDNTSTKFNTLKQTDEAIDAFNKAVYGPNKETYQNFIDFATIEEMTQHYTNEKKKFDNASFLEVEQPISSGLAFANYINQPTSKNRYGKGDNRLMRYPYDIDVNQDHLKITRYNYVRPNLNMSKSAGRTNVKNNQTGGGQPIDGTVAGDSVVGSDLKGTILLPMPKVTDVNGVEWGKSELNSAGLTALNITNELTLRGRLSGKNEEDRLNDVEIREAIASRKETNSGREGAAALYTGTIAKLAGTLTGSDLDADTFLARQGGKVLNPNAEMLFQGPVIRDFGFSFVMIARSEEEGREIRSIIRFLKLGLAPKFRSTTFLENPDVFTLEYRNGPEQKDILNTVNRFSPGGLALTTMRVDYAPNGYWSAYRDSQPVAVKMDLDFTELRPIYEGDQLNIDGDDHVGY